MKQVYSILILFFLVSFDISAQNEADIASEETKSAFRLYVAAGYGTNQLVEANASFAEIHAGVEFKERIDLDAFYGFNLDEFSQQIIFPAVHRYDQENLGLRLRYFVTKTKIRPHVGVGYQLSMASWTPEEGTEDHFNDNIHGMDVFAGLNWSINRRLNLLLDGGYHFVDSVELIDLEPADYEGFSLKIMLKIGLFTF